MLDNNKHIIEEGWQRMSALLDTEMPVEDKRKRRGIFWMWLAASTFGIVLAGSAYFLLNPSEPIRSEISTPELGKVAGKAPIAAKTDMNETQTVVIAPIKTVVAAQPTYFAPTETPVATNIFENLPASSVDDEVQPEMMLRNSASELALQPVLPLERNPVNILNPKISAIQLPEVGQTKIKALKFGMEGALGFNPIVSGWNVASFGPIVELPLSPKWKLRAGLQVASENYPITSNATNRSLSLSSDPEATNFQNDGTALSVVARSVEFGYIWTFKTGGIQAPITVEHRLHSRWSAEAGVTPIYWWNVSNANGLVFSDPGPVLGAQNIFSMADLDQSVVSSINRFDCRISAGVRYRVNPKWSLGAHYQASLIDLQNAPLIVSKQNLLRLSSIYYL